MNIGQFVGAEIIILLIISSVEKLIVGLESFYDILTSLEKIGQVVDKDLEPQEGEEPFKYGETFTIELDEVSYKVQDKDKKILDTISLKITEKSSILIQGSVGSGKSTLLKLITGLLEPDSGSIYVNNISLKAINLSYYRGLLGHSLSEESPFEGTILENITFGDKEITTNQVYWALEKVGLLEFVKEQPKGLSTMLYPEGKQIPYTINKKILLARGIVRKPKLLLLKDPLDQFNETEASEIMDFLVDPENPWALIVVSENSKWASHCQRIVNMHNGKIIN